jgi:hypothetical protein
MTVEVNGVPQSLDPEDEWVRSETAPTEQACTGMIDNTLLVATFGYMKGMFEPRGAEVSAAGRTVSVSWKGSKGQRVMKSHLQCLPDTIDPRGPKGK